MWICSVLYIWKRNQLTMWYFYPKVSLCPTFFSFKLHPIFWMQKKERKGVVPPSLSLDAVNLCPLCVPAKLSVELAFDQPWKAQRSGRERWTRTEWAWGWGWLALGERGLWAEWKKKVGVKRVWERPVLKELAYSLVSFGRLWVRLKYGDCWENVHVCLLHLHFSYLHAA